MPSFEAIAKIGCSNEGERTFEAQGRIRDRYQTAIASTQAHNVILGLQTSVRIQGRWAIPGFGNDGMTLYYATTLPRERADVGMSCDLPRRAGAMQPEEGITCEVVRSESLIMISQVCHAYGETKTTHALAMATVAYAADDKLALRDLERFLDASGNPAASFNGPEGLIQQAVEYRSEVQVPMLESWADDRQVRVYWTDLRAMRERLEDVGCIRDDVEEGNMTMDPN